MRIVFMGTPDFAKESLEALFDDGKNEIAAVVTNVDKPKGRGMKIIETPVKQYAKEKNLKIYQPHTLKNNKEFVDEMWKIKPDLFCVVAYGKILPKEILQIPKYGAINVHASLLPKYRGAAPIQWAIINGDKETGITTMFMDEGMDTGDIILQEKVQIKNDETTGELWNRLSVIGGKMLVKTVEKIENATQKNEKIDLKELKRKIGAVPQGDNFTMAPMLNKDISIINWNKSALEIYNLIRGLNPIMGCVAFYKTRKIKIWKARIVEKDLQHEAEEKSKIIEKEENGTIIEVDKNGFYVKTGNGILSIIELQAENGKRMDYRSFLNGNKINAGEKFDINN